MTCEPPPVSCGCASPRPCPISWTITSKPNPPGAIDDAPRIVGLNAPTDATDDGTVISPAMPFAFRLESMTIPQVAPDDDSVCVKVRLATAAQVPAAAITAAIWAPVQDALAVWSPNVCPAVAK